MSDSASVERDRIASAKRWRLGSALAAVVIPLVLYALFDRQARRLDALADHGAQTMATSATVRDRYLEYRYEVQGTTHTSSVARDQVPAPEALAIRYLPEEPSFSRPDSDGSRTRAEVAKNRANVPKILLGVFAFSREPRTAISRVASRASSKFVARSHRGSSRSRPPRFCSRRPSR